MDVFFIFVLLFALGLITVIGHALWVLLAMIFRAIFGADEQPVLQNQPVFDARCAECGAGLRLGDDFCSGCGRWQGTQSKAGPVVELALVARLLDRLLNQGKLDSETHRRVMQAVEEERQRLTAPFRQPAAPPPATQPVPVEARDEVEPALAQVAPAAIEQHAFAVEREKSDQRVVEPDIPIEPARPIAAAPEQPAQPRRSFTEMLETFMEESSIRWGELIGGLLIIGCSIALVVSLWSEIASRPLLKFSVFVGVTTALFGLGFYSAHRWRLPTTSRGALIISTLLVPLNFLAMAAFSRDAAPPSLLIVIGELFSVALFLFLVFKAAQVFAPEPAWMLALATLGPSFSMLMARHSGDEGWPRMMLLGAAPVLCYWVSSGLTLRAFNRRGEIEERDADQIFTLLGIASFATLLPLGLLFVKPGHIPQTLRQFAPLISLFGVPAIATGIALLQGSAETRSGKTQTAATSVSIIGSLIALAAMFFAWPNPTGVIITALINCAVCVAVALMSSQRIWRYDLRLAHAGAVAHLTLAALVVANLFNGNIVSWVEDGGRLAASFGSKTSGVTLTLLFAVFAVLSEYWLRIERRVEARIYGIASIALGAAAILLMTARGFGRAGDPHQAAWGYAFYAAAAFVIAWRKREAIAAWIGSGLLLLAIVQLFVFKFGGELAPHHPLRLSLLVFASVTTVAAVIAHRLSEQARRVFGEPFVASALICSLIVAPFALFGGWMTNGQISARLLWLAAIWLIIAWLKRWSWLFAAFQVALTLCVAFGVAALFGHEWPHSFLRDLRTMQAQAVALALLSLGWVAARLIFSRFGVTAGFGVDRVVTLLLLCFLIGLSVLGAFAGMTEELAPGQALLASRNFVATALGAGSWYLLIALSLVFVAGLWERFQKRLVVATLMLLACACSLIAGRWQADGMTVSVFRWSSAIAFTAVSLLIVFRHAVAGFAGHFGWPQMEERANGLSALLRRLSLVLFAAPVLIFTLLAFFKAPATISSAPAQAGAVALLIGPILLLMFSFIAHAARERSAEYACAAGLMVNLAATLGYLQAQTLAGASWGLATAYSVAQFNIIATSVCSLVWLAAHRRWARPRSEGFLKTQIDVALLSALSLLALAGARLFFDPWSNSALASSFGGLLGWVAVLLPMIAYSQVREIKVDQLRVEQFGVGLLAVCSLLVCSLSRLDDGWVAYRALMLVVNAVAWLMLALRCGTRWHLVPRLSARLTAAVAQLGNQRSIENWIAVSSLAVVAMILRGVNSPGEPWWTVAFSISICLLLAGLSVISRERGYVYLSAATLNFAATRFLTWMKPGFLVSSGFINDLLSLLAVNAIALALPAMAWLALELKVLNRSGEGNSASRVAPFHRIAARISFGLMWIIFGIELLFDGLEELGNPILSRLALASVIALLVACLWDRNSGYALRRLYGIGLIAIGMLFVSLNLNFDGLVVSVAVALPLYALATSVLWRERERFRKLAGALRMPWSNEPATLSSSWLIAVNGLISVITYFLTLAIIFNFEETLAQRLIAATAAFAIPASFALLARSSRNQSLITASVSRDQSALSDRTESGWNQSLITACVRLALLSVVLWGWAWLRPDVGWRLVERLVIVMLIAGAVVVGYRFIVSRALASDNEWRRGVKAQLPWVAMVGLALLAVVLYVEAANYFSSGNAQVSWPVITAVLATLIGLSCACVAFALLPGEDPFDLDERGRMRYVYGAEVMVVLTLLHTRLTMPWLFSGFFQTYWPLIVMLLAFVGVGVGELFRRQGKLVLAEPLERTGILLPLLPVIGFWVVGSQVSYSGLLFLVGLFYGVLSVTQRSFKFGMLAALAANGGLWRLLSEVDGFGFYQHPQLWLIPVSLSVLLAARINRDRLSPEQMTMIRYATLMTVYVSSTADVFINGVSESPWLTMVLAVLSVAGVIAGLVMRVRAFLFLGTAFLLLSVLTMIWTASVNLGWVWLWYVTGIAFGVMIICTFALFERKRREMLGLVEKLKQWQA
jgi:hypothetical protein